MPIFMMKGLLWSTPGSATQRTRIPIMSILLQYRKDAIPVEQDLERGREWKKLSSSILRKEGNIFFYPQVTLLIAPMLSFWCATLASKDKKIQ
jgi:hypothetical protein